MTSLSAHTQSEIKREAAALTVGQPNLIDMGSMTPKPIDWQWRYRLANGKPCVLAGPPGRGKSLLTIDMAARLSRGDGWPDAPYERREPAGTLFLSAEDDPEDTICPRLDAADADRSFVRVMDGIVAGIDEDGHRIIDGATLADWRKIAMAIDLMNEQGLNCKLVVIDPVSSFMGKTDAHVDAAVRGVVAPLSRMAADKGVALVLVAHLNKRATGDSFARVGGSIAWLALARTAFLFYSLPDDPKERRLFAPIKANNLMADTLACSIVDAGNDHARVEWEAEPVDMTADDILAAQNETTQERPDRDEATAFLLAELQESPKGLTAKEVKRRASDAGHSWRTIERAKAELGIKPHKEAFGGGWIWRLPGAVCEDRQPDPMRESVAVFGDRGGLGDSEQSGGFLDKGVGPENDENCEDRQQKTVAVLGENDPDDAPPPDHWQHNGTASA